MPSQNALSESIPPIRIRLPATSANLGPGFDTLGLALSLYLTIEAHQSDQTEIKATGRDVPLTGSLSNNLILMTYEEIFRDLGLAAPAISIKLHNEIPLGMGCGSSAAALLAGVLLANHFGQLFWSSQQILDEACRREGHPDNVAACLYGGMTVSATHLTDSISPEPSISTATFGRKSVWRLVLALARSQLATAQARAILPSTYTRSDTVASLQSASLLVSAFALDRPELLRVAMRDCLHQPFRASVCPLLPALLPLAGQHGIFGVALSGAGPAVLLIASPTVSLATIEQAITEAGGVDLAEILILQVGEAATTSTASR